MVNTQTSWWRRCKVDKRPTDELPDRGSGTTASYPDDASEYAPMAELAPGVGTAALGGDPATAS